MRVWWTAIVLHAPLALRTSSFLPPFVCAPPSAPPNPTPFPPPPHPPTHSQWTSPESPSSRPATRSVGGRAWCWPARQQAWCSMRRGSLCQRGRTYAQVRGRGRRGGGAAGRLGGWQRFWMRPGAARATCLPRPTACCMRPGGKLHTSAPFSLWQLRPIHLPGLPHPPCASAVLQLAGHHDQRQGPPTDRDHLIPEALKQARRPCCCCCVLLAALSPSAAAACLPACCCCCCSLLLCRLELPLLAAAQRCAAPLLAVLCHTSPVCELPVLAGLG